MRSLGVWILRGGWGRWRSDVQARCAQWRDESRSTAPRAWIDERTGSSTAAETETMYIGEQIEMKPSRA